MERIRWSTIFGLLIFAGSIATIAFSVNALQEQHRRSRLLEANAPLTLTASVRLSPSSVSIRTITAAAPTEATPLPHGTPTNVVSFTETETPNSDPTEVLTRLVTRTPLPLITNTAAISPSPQPTLTQIASQTLTTSTPRSTRTPIPSATPRAIADAAAGQPVNAALTVANPPM